MRRGGSGRGPRHVGAAYLLLSVLGPLTALVLARHFHLGVPATAVSVLLGLASAYLAWASFRADRAEADPVELDKIVDELAVAVKTQWDNESVVRRVNDPYPLPVAWCPADLQLAESWELLTGLAGAWPGGPPGDPSLWPADASGLAGRDGEIGQVFSEKVPTRRLVILGEPGAGKSVLLIRLLQDLIARRTDGAPVPVLFSLASWDPRQSLKDWMADKLRRTHRGLTAPSHAALAHAAADEPGDLALHLLNTGRVLPLLDGFDELPPARHATALDMLNRALPARQPLVLTSRTDPYRTALTRPGTTVRLNGAAAIQLQPLDAQEAAHYLRRDAGGPHTPAATRWNTVSSQLGTTSPAGQALSTPLGLFLARTIYNPRPDASPTPPQTPHPDELCDTATYPDRTAINTRLFQAFIPAAYTPHQPNPPRWTAEQAHRTFVILADFQQNQRAGSPDIAWWELSKAFRQRTLGLLLGGCAVGLVGALVGGPVGGLAAGAVGGLVAGLVGGFVFGFTFGFFAGYSDVATPRVRFRISPSASLSPGRLVLRLVIVLAVLSLIMFGARLSIWPAFELAGAVAAGLALVLTFESAVDAPDLTSSSGPATLFALDRRTFFTIALTVGLATAAVFVLTTGTVGGLETGIATGLVLGITEGLAETAWGFFLIGCTYLAARRKIPRQVMAFLQDAHEQRGVLRQAGAVYQFRHIDLQRHLAQNPAGGAPAWSRMGEVGLMARER
ncbi:NACHT domain-containing protein [Streptomyces sp. NPDC050625]|uniref:NACHT domain-containing protein n=1 Tax=Streptomyces sp. NPDC050625 TaxID=3154629 RepID=UPI003439A662